MDQKIKNYVGIALAVGIVVGAYSVWRIAGAYGRSIQPSSFRSFSVSAEGKAIAVPDVAKFTFSVVTEGGTDLAKLQKENTERMNDALAFVEKSNVKKEDIKTAAYAIEPRYEYYSCNASAQSGAAKTCPPPVIVGYAVRQKVEVKMRDFAKSGAIIAGVVESGANSVSELSFTIDDPTGIESEARAEAIRKAREKALAVAKAGGFGLGRILNIFEDGYEPAPVYAMKEASFDMGGDSYAAPRVEAGSTDVKVNVTITYEIK